MKSIPRHLEAVSRRERSRVAGEREPAAEILSESEGPQKPTKTIPHHPKLRGEFAEVHFLARASEHGLSVSKPYGDCLPYDFIVEHHGRMLRVQVKSTSFQAPGYTGYKCFVKPSPKGKRYPAGALDFIAAYILPEDIWYIIPFGKVRSKATVHLDPRSPRNRYHPYREAWHLLRGEKPCGTQPALSLSKGALACAAVGRGL